MQTPRQTSSRTRLAVVTATSALALGAMGALAAAPAQAAAAPATLQVKVVDSVTQQPLVNVEVIAFNDNTGKYVDFGGTSADGTLSRTAGGIQGSNKLTAGTWGLELDDYSLPRFKNDTTHASVLQQGVKITAGANDQGTITMDTGGIVDGTTTTPSGQLLRGMDLIIDSDSDEAGDGFDGGFGYYSPSANGDATYEQNGLATGDYTVSYDPGSGKEDGSLRDAGAPFTISAPGQKVTDDVVVRVAATGSLTTLKASSPAKGSARLVFTTGNAYYDITDPHGVVTFTSAAGKQIGDPVAVSSTGKATAEFPASAGSHTYIATYDSGAGNPADLLKTSRTVKVSVK